MRNLKAVVGTTGMAIVSKNNVFVSEEREGGRFVLKLQPKFMFTPKYKYFETFKLDSFYRPEEIKSFNNTKYDILMSILIMVNICVLFEAKTMPKVTIGISQMVIGLVMLVYDSFVHKKKIKFFEVEKIMAQKRGALNKAINLYYRLDRTPSLDELKKEPLRGNFIKKNVKIYNSIFNTFGKGFYLLGILLVLPNINWLTVSLILGLTIVIRHIITVSEMTEPTEYALNEARALIAYYIEFSKDL